jgi:hypothetical protein
MDDDGKRTILEKTYFALKGLRIHGVILRTTISHGVECHHGRRECDEAQDSAVLFYVFPISKHTCNHTLPLTSIMDGAFSLVAGEISVHRLEFFFRGPFCCTGFASIT